MNLRRSHIALLLLVLLSACTPKVPKEYIQPDDMEDILYDYFVSQGIAKQETGSTSDRLSDYKRELYFEAVLKKYDLTRAEFDSSLVYYYTRSDRFVKIWKNVQERLGEAAIEYGASAGEVQTFTASTLTGDTANVWNGVISQVLVPYSPYNRLQFQIHAADTAYRKGDSFMLTWNSNFLYQSGSKDGVAYMAVRYKNDSIVSTVSHFSVDGYSQLFVAFVDDGVGATYHLAAHVGYAGIGNVALHMVVYFLQDDGLAGAFHTLCIVGMVGEYQARERSHRAFQFRHAEPEEAGYIGRLAVHGTRHLGLAVVAQGIHQLGIRQRRGYGIDIGSFVTIDKTRVGTPVE